MCVLLHAWRTAQMGLHNGLYRHTHTDTRSADVTSLSGAIFLFFSKSSSSCQLYQIRLGAAVLVVALSISTVYCTVVFQYNIVVPHCASCIVTSFFLYHIMDHQRYNPTWQGVASLSVWSLGSLAWLRSDKTANAGVTLPSAFQ